LTKPRIRPTQRYIALIVKPLPGFNPSSWQDVPQTYRVIEFVGPKQFRGRADAWRFMENKAVLDEWKNEQGIMQKDPIQRWAVVID